MDMNYEASVNGREQNKLKGQKAAGNFNLVTIWSSIFYHFKNLIFNGVENRD